MFRVTKIMFIVTMWDTGTGSFPYDICDRDVTSQTLWRGDGSGGGITPNQAIARSEFEVYREIYTE